MYYSTEVISHCDFFRDRAQAALAAAKAVIDALKKAKEAQDAAQDAIDMANNDIKMVQDKLKEVRTVGNFKLSEDLGWMNE